MLRLQSTRATVCVRRLILECLGWEGEGLAVRAGSAAAASHTRALHRFDSVFDSFTFYGGVDCVLRFCHLINASVAVRSVLSPPQTQQSLSQACEGSVHAWNGDKFC